MTARIAATEDDTDGYVVRDFRDVVERIDYAEIPGEEELPDARIRIRNFQKERTVNDYIMTIAIIQA